MRATIRQVDRAAQRSTAQAVRALKANSRGTAAAVRKTARAALLADVRSHGPMTMSGLGAKLGVKTKVAASPTSATVTLVASPAGPWAIDDAGAGPHVIRPHNKALKLGRGHAAVVVHPGTAGRRRWDRAQPAIERAVLEVVTAAAAEALDL